MAGSSRKAPHASVGPAHHQQLLQALRLDRQREPCGWGQLGDGLSRSTPSIQSFACTPAESSSVGFTPIATREHPTVVAGFSLHPPLWFLGEAERRMFHAIPEDGHPLSFRFPDNTQRPVILAPVLPRRSVCLKIPEKFSDSPRRHPTKEFRWTIPLVRPVPLDEVASLARDGCLQPLLKC